MKLQRFATIIFVIVCTVTTVSSVLAQGKQKASANGGQAQPVAEPLSKKRLLKLLTLNDSTQQELTQVISQKGVDFQATPSDERELHDAGACDDLIVAVRANYRGAASANTQTGNAATADQPSPNAATPAPKKKGLLSKLGAKMNAASSTLNQNNSNQQNGNSQANDPTATQPSQLSSPSTPSPSTNGASTSQVNDGTQEKKKGTMDKIGQKVAQVNAQVAKVNSKINQIPGASVAATVVSPTAAAPLVVNVASQAIAAKTNAQSQSANTAGEAAQPTKKHSVFDKLSQGLNKVNQSLNQTNATQTKQPPGNPESQNTTSPAPTVAAIPATSSNAPARSSITTNTGSGPADLAGTSWDLLSMTKKGEKEEVNGTTPNVQFCHDGSWAILHNGSSEGGKYQIQGNRLVMKTSDGALYGDYPIKRNGNEMILDDGTWVLRLRYYGPVKC